MSTTQEAWRQRSAVVVEAHGQSRHQAEGSLQHPAFEEVYQADSVAGAPSSVSANPTPVWPCPAGRTPPQDRQGGLGGLSNVRRGTGDGVALPAAVPRIRHGSPPAPRPARDGRCATQQAAQFGRRHGADRPFPICGVRAVNQDVERVRDVVVKLEAGLATIQLDLEPIDVFMRDTPREEIVVEAGWGRCREGGLDVQEYY
ncbi:hypothetical protein NUW54_g12763 [Trametes sanguinea]|uniref:Uncharacterized protein n=1 Tax=Trametes sanguinea TaxID=158606 RepID=A0ACC1MTC4_9APHY|nr:hypothetical protein NUW54_g12763 [Trametes sanguinea]